MLVRSVPDGFHFQALDQTTICELLHPDQENLDIPYSLAHALLKPGAASLPHFLKQSSEVCFILEGQGIMHIDDETSPVGPGQAVYIPPGSKQYIQNIGTNDLKFLCIVHPMWRKDDEVIMRL
jgi:mannose-6-phosphate isomerase-like protein (cupin superfamily)